MVDFHLKLIFLGLFSCFIYTYSYGQLIDNNRVNPYQKVFIETDNFGDSYLEYLAQGLDTVENDSVHFSILNDLAYYWHTRNLNTALDFTRKGLQLTKVKENVLWEGRFQMTQGAILLRMEKLDSAQTVLQLAKTKVLESDLPFLNTQLGYVYERRGQLDKAADYAMTSLTLGEKLNDNKAKAMAYSDLSNLFWKQSKFTPGLEYALKSLEFFNSWGITDLDYGFTLYIAGNNYLALKDYEKALDYYMQSIVVGERYGFYNNLSDVYISLVDLYSFLGEFDNAKEAGQNAVKYAALLENNFMVMRSWLSVGKMHNAKNNYKDAVNALERCLEVATNKFGDAYYLSLAYKELGMAYAGINQYKKAYEAFSEYDTLNDEVFTAEADHRISELRTEFDVAQKESIIMVQESLIKKQEIRQKLGIVISILLALLLLLAYKAISNNNKKNKLLQKQNTEKEFLLKEIHHRVKNNLEIVSSLLSLQSAQIEDPNVLNAMEQSQQRVHSMGMIHQKLYLGENMATIEMKDYFSNLSDYIINTYGKDSHVAMALEMEKFELDVDMAIPIGLIVNELITNSLKYAFPDDRKGNIQLSLKEKNDLITLEVIDNGVGMQLSKEAVGTGFGTKLVALLVKQLDGKMELHTTQGTSVFITFKASKAA
ncbi:tetratricopeptide repeat-containing sensor histidine kinase [Maribacter antarcticus]|uniref:tetratricopeptide repeat-containing sensor histidine kinase n=1 Tax=Maribacter antarcticus TaxID=505250 RepID=UPI0009FF1D7D|nr:histidine kinase dimerization/phosphoacceptor domain -containing protein [Maribacter antarcticus]